MTRRFTLRLRRALAGASAAFETKRSRGRARGLLLLASVAIGACSTTATRDPTDEPRPSLPPEPAAYLLQRGDRIAIRVFGIPELDEEVVIRPDGWISVALLDDVLAVGLSAEQLAARLEEGFAKDLTAPKVSVLVIEFAHHNVYVGGEVTSPGLIPLRNRLTSLKAIVLAGGFMESAQLTNVVVLRDAGGKPKIMKLNAKQIMAGDATDLILRPFDVVFVPKSKIARVNMFVDQYIKGVLPVNLQGSVNYTYIGGNDAQ